MFSLLKENDGSTPCKSLIMCVANKALGIKERSFKQFRPVGFFYKFALEFCHG